MKKMKNNIAYVMLGALLALVGQSCTKDAANDPAPAQGTEYGKQVTPVQEEANDPILFGYKQADADTRATNLIDGTTVTTIPNGEKVGVFGYFQDVEAWNYGMPADFFFNDPMTSDGVAPATTANLTYSPLRFWPNGTGQMLAFYGYYPYNGAGIVIDNTGGMGTFQFTAQGKSSEQIDFMVSDLEKDLTKPSAAAMPTYRVNLKFRHALARILVNVDISKPDGEWESVKSIKITKVKTVGTLDPSYIAQGHPGAAWDNHNNDGEVEIDQLPAVGSLVSTADSKYALLMIPQEVFFDHTEIHLVLHNQHGNDVEFKFGIKDVWEMGKTYIYNLKTISEISLLSDPHFHGNAGQAANGGTITN